MMVVDPGHEYELDCLDEVSGWAEEFSRLRFVKRIGDRYPGNDPPGHSGTTTQEVIRALIDRTRYVDDQRPHRRNLSVVRHLRAALRHLELRAAETRNEGSGAIHAIVSAESPELMPTCDHCGHIECHFVHEARR